jgi:hypothetical protein
VCCSVQLRDTVQLALAITELQPGASRIVGTPGGHGLSHAEFSRFVVAAELMAKPSILLCGARTGPVVLAGMILFADCACLWQPSKSGRLLAALSARAMVAHLNWCSCMTALMIMFHADALTAGLGVSDALVMRVLRAIAATGCIIVCMVHAAPGPVLERFDDLLLLQCGRQIYYGPVGPGCSRAVRYFASLSGARKLEHGACPVTHLLEVCCQPWFWLFSSFSLRAVGMGSTG